MRLRCLPLGELGDKPAFLVFGKSAGDLAHHLTAEIVAVGEVVARRGQQAHAALRRQSDAKLLHRQLAGEPAGVFHDHGADAVARCDRGAWRSPLCPRSDPRS
jgi:hypothetical protein